MPNINTLDTCQKYSNDAIERIVAAWDSQQTVEQTRVLSCRHDSWTAHVYLRKPPMQVLIKSHVDASRIAKEKGVRRLLATSIIAPLLPEVLFIDVEGGIIGTSVVVLLWVPGIPWARDKAPPSGAVTRRLGIIIRNLHCCRMPLFGFLGQAENDPSPGHHSWGSYLKQILYRTLHQNGEFPRKALGLCRCEQVVECVAGIIADDLERPQLPVLCHGDVRFVNVILARDIKAKHIVSLVDWEMAESADALWDIGCFYANEYGTRAIWWTEFLRGYFTPQDLTTFSAKRILTYAVLKLVDHLCYRPIMEPIGIDGCLWRIDETLEQVSHVSEAVDLWQAAVSTLRPLE